MLKVSPWKGIDRFGKKGKLSSRYVGSFVIIECVREVAYKLDLPEELRGIHPTFHVSNLRKCLADAAMTIPLENIKVDEKLTYVDEPVVIVDRNVRKLRTNEIVLVKVQWRYHRGQEAT